MDIWGSGGSKQTATCQRSGTTGRRSVCGRGAHILEGPRDPGLGPHSPRFHPQVLLVPPSGPLTLSLAHRVRQDPSLGSHGDALQPSPSDTGDAGPLGTQQPACLRGSAVWKERDQAGDRPGPTGLGKVAGAREGGSQCPLTPAWTQTGGVATPSSRLLGVGTMLPELSLFAKVLGKGRLLPKLPL